MAKVNVYLTFQGNCELAFNFYQSALGGEFKDLSRFGEMPPEEGMPELSNEMKNRLMHVSLPISTETVLMGSDTVPGFGPDVTMGDNFSISLNVDSKEEADSLFAKLSEGGTITMPLDETFWGSYFGMLKDQFGINWMVNHDLLENE
ncbi:PhnB protein [Dyadobacter jejuensis]|uniref:PhnB protein n=1 Tax=Dyadobacter jejuensis TaxID=1082580 RepID=A0A316ALX0_9BACT|nr:VOC family protein [Dyadobacter jejuensis]PWJ58259.1 PhnB protein [Dyadobacter jejuensis]